MQFPTRVSAALALCFLALGTVATAQNQYVILYPGAKSPSTILQAYLPSSGGLFASASINTLPPGTSQILPTPDGTKYYILSVNGNSLTLVGLPPTVIDISRARANGNISGSLSLGRSIVAYGYYQNGVFFATSIR